MEHIRYSAAACQTDLANPTDRSQMRKNTDRMLSMVDSAVAGSAPFLPVKLVVFPEFAHAAPVFPTVQELRQKLTVPIPNEHTERLTEKAREHGIYIQSGTMLEEGPQYPEVVFNTSCLVGPSGILSKYRKVNPWIPYEVHASPHDLPDYDQPLFPVTETPIGRLGCAICYDWLFPEVLRRLAANGAEVLIRVSAYMDPWGATEPMAWWTLVNRSRALENLAYVVAANQAPKGVGRCRMLPLADASVASLHPFVTDHVEPRATVITDGWAGYSGLEKLGYVHDRRSQRAARACGEDPGALLPAVHRVVSLAKRWLLGTHQGSVEPAHLASYLNEFVFRFNRRRSRSRGMVFYRVLELAVAHDPVRYQDLIATRRPRAVRPTPPQVRGHPPSLERPPANRPWRTAALNWSD